MKESEFKEEDAFCPEEIYEEKGKTEKEKYFDYRFFIQHSIVVENEFVKDLQRIGRQRERFCIF